MRSVFIKSFDLKCPYYGSLKITFHAVCNSSTWIKTSCKVLNLKVHRVKSYCLSKERVDTESMKPVIFKTNPKPSCWRQHETLAYCPPTCWSFRLVWMKMQIHSLPLGAAFGKNSSFPGNTVHKAALRSQTLLLYQADRWAEIKMRTINQSPQISVTQRRGLAKRIHERIVWESLSK